MRQHTDGTLILVRTSGEIATKARGTRRRFQRRLIQNLEAALDRAGIEASIDAGWGRIFIAATDRAALRVIPRIFGIASISEVEAVTGASLDAIIRAGVKRYRARVQGGTFAVRARRAGRHDFSSRDVNYELGAALNRYAEVDLDDPDVTVYVEVREDTAYLFSERIPAAGGLPLGVEGRALALVSGGYDSAVAAWMMLKRGVALDYLFCNLAGPAYERAVLAVVKQLADVWGHGTRPRVHVVEFERPLAELREHVSPSFWQVVLKRLMYRAGGRVAAELGARALVTGESIGQVSSQTLPNLTAIEACVDLPVLRPLVGFDKEEIVQRSREIGTYALSAKVREHCALTEEHPVTAATAAEAASQEAKFDLEVLERAVSARRVLELSELAVSDLVMPYLYTSEIGAEAIVIDVRPAAEYDAWHYPGAVHREYWDLLRDPGGLDRERTYVLYCGLGVKSAQLAEKLQSAGLEAYSFKGGTDALKAYARRASPDHTAAGAPSTD